MLLLLLSLGCNRGSCESSTLTKFAETNCEYWAACPEFAPFFMESMESHEACVEAMITREREVCQWATEAPCNGELSPGRVVSCVRSTRDAMETCAEVSGCEYLDTGSSGDAMYQEVDLACMNEDD